MRGSEGEGTALHTLQFTPPFCTFPAFSHNLKIHSHTGVVGVPYIQLAVVFVISRLF